MIPCKPTACDDRSRLCRAIESDEAQARRGAALTPALSHGEKGVDSRLRGNDGGEMGMTGPTHDLDHRGNAGR